MGWRYRDTVLVLAAFANFAQLSSRLAISPVVPNIIETFSVSKGMLGLALTGMWVMFAVMQYPGGVLSDRYGERPVILVALSITGLASLLVALSPTFSTFALFVLILGTGNGLYFVVGASLLTKLFENRGQALGVHGAGAAVAGLVAPVIAGYIGVTYGWRAAVTLGLAIVLPAVILILWKVRVTPPTRAQQSMLDRFSPSMLLDILSRPRILYSSLIAGIGIFVFQAIASFFPTFLIEFRHLETTNASIAFGAIFLVSAITQPAAGRLSDRYGRDVIIAIAMLTTAAGFGVLLWGPALVAIILGVGLVGAGLTWFGVIQARIMDSFSPEERGTGFGVVRSVYMLIGASGSFVTGVLVDFSGWVLAFGVVGFLLVLAFLTLTLNRTFHLGL